ncbi:MAG: autotransporter-associated beta strand repeat-containing protein [Gemmataceae bacterium]
MNTLPHYFRSALLVRLALAATLAVGGTVHAQTWTNIAAGTYSWNATASWGGSAFPNAIDAVANMGVDITGDQTINLGAAITVGSLTYGDINSSNIMTIASGNSLTFSASAGSANFTTSANTNNNAINAAVVLSSSLIATHGGTGLMTFGGVVSGAGSLTKLGTGTIVLSGANTYTGGNVITAGTLRGTVAGAFGANTTANAINLNGGTLELFSDTATTFTNSAVTVAAASTINTSRATAGAGVTHTIGALSLGTPILTINPVVATSGTQALTVGAVTLTGNATLNVAPTALSGVTSLVTVGAVGGGFSLTKTGTGNLTFSAAGTYTGGTLIQGGVVQVNNNTSLGTGDVTVATTVAGRLLINAGVTIANNAILNTSVGVAGTGLIQQTGTGQARINGTITINGNGSAGGHFVAGTAAGNELVIGGAINSPNANQGFSQRAGRIIYIGGGNVTGAMSVTDTAFVGATNGIPVGVIPTLGGSGNATLDLGTNGFDQTLAGLTIGNATNAFISTVTLGARTLTLNGDITSVTGTTISATHQITASTGGGISFGATNRSFILPDSLAFDDAVMTGGSIFGTGGMTKSGAGTLVLKNVAVVGPLTVSAGTLATAPTGTTGGTLTTGALAFGATPTTVRLDVGGPSEVINGGTVTTTSGGTVSFSLTAVGGSALPNGQYNLITYTGTSPGLANFTIGSFGHATATLVDTGSAIAVNVTGNQKVLWTGAVDGNWDINTTANWKTQVTNASTNYVQGDDIVFADAPTGTSTITLAAQMFPSGVAFTNTTATPYSITAATAVGINGITGLSKTGNGTVTLSTANAYTGATTVAAGMLVLNHDVTGNVVLSASSGVSIASGATLQLIRTDGPFTFSRDMSGTGTVEVNAHAAAGSTTSHSIVLSGNNTGFTGTLRLLSPVSGTYRINQPTPAQLGNGTIEVQNGAQLLVGPNASFANNISITGTGFVDTNGNLGALRLDNSTWAGNVFVNGTARIGAHNSTGIVSGNISGGDTEFNVSNYANNYTLILSGTNTYGATILGGGNTQGTLVTMRLNIGNGGTTGTLGTGNVTINGDGANGILGFDRSNGYTLRAGQTITGAVGGGTVANSITRTFIDLDTLGTGFSDNGNTITLGAGTPLGGGSIRVGQSRANAVATFTGTLTAEQIISGSAATGGILNFNTGANVTANLLYAGNAANVGGTINITGGTINIRGQVRAGHFGTETSTINMSGGTLTLTGDSPTLTPSTAGAGGASATGDNNINALAVAQIDGGGIYLGIDGTGILNHTGGTITTNWLVLDNRGDTTAGANMPDGIDRYNISGASTVLNIRSAWGLIARNASTSVNFGGGTIRVDNTGTGGPAGNTGANITVPLDATIDTVAATTTTLNTNGAGNAFTLTRDVRGTGTLSLTGGGTVNFSTTGFQNISATLVSTGTGASLVKLGTGTTTLNSAAGFTGSITVSAGRLNLPTNLGAGPVAVADGAILGGEPTAITGLTIGTTAGGSRLVFDPATTGAITAGTLTVNGSSANLLDVPSYPAPGTYTAINFTTLAGTGTFAFANATNYRTPPTVATSATAVTVTFAAGANLTWTGATSAAWNINTTQNWNNAVPAADVFFSGDAVTFPEGGANPAITITGLVAPSSITVNAATTAYTFTATAGNQIIGGTGITKTGAGTLTLTGANAYTGVTSIGGGTVVINGTNSIGDGSASNTIAISGGGRLSYNNTTALDLGVNRAIAVGTGGGSISHNNATAANITIGGNITGSGALSFHSAAAGAGTFILNGNNAGYTGNITVDAASTGITVLRINTPSAAPGGGSITLNYPAAGATGNATTLDLPGTSLPAAVTLNMTSFLNGTISLRSQVTSNGNSTINGPLTVSGNSIVQYTVATGALTINGNITETTAGGFTGTFFVRGASTAVSAINGTINLPTAGSGVSKTDAGTWQINSTGNVFPNAGVFVGTLRMGIAGALPANVNLTLGQNDTNTAVLDLNGFDQTVGSLVSNPTTVGANTTPKSITSATAANFTVNQSTTTTYASLITGAVSLASTGSGSLTLSATTSSFTGNVTVSGGGTLVAAGTASSNTTGPLGNPSTAGRTVTVNSGATLSFTSNNIFGNGVGNSNLPAVILNGTTLTSTRYNVLGNLTLNGATLTQSATDTGAYEGYQFRGTVTVGGTAASTIATGNSKANHLAATTVFTVADATSSAAADLIVSTPLRNPSGDYSTAEPTGGLTKSGPGTMVLSAANTYSGSTTVNAGVLQIVNTTGSGTGTGPVTVANGGTLNGTGFIVPTGTNGVTVQSGGTLKAGTSPGVLTINTLAGATVSLAAGSTFAVDVQGTTPGNTTTNHGQLVVTGGTLNLGGATLAATFSGYTPSTSDTINIINYTGASLVGSFNGLPEGSIAYTNVLGSGIDYRIFYGTQVANRVTLSPVPEPATCLTIALAGVAAMNYVRRRRAVRERA